MSRVVGGAKLNLSKVSRGKKATLRKSKKSSQKFKKLRKVTPLAIKNLDRRSHSRPSLVSRHTLTPLAITKNLNSRLYSPRIGASRGRNIFTPSAASSKKLYFQSRRHSSRTVRRDSSFSNLSNLSRLDKQSSRKLFSNLATPTQISKQHPYFSKIKLGRLNRPD